MRVLGPNSLGLFNTADNFFGTFATALDGAWPRAGGVGVGVLATSYDGRPIKLDGNPAPHRPDPDVRRRDWRRR